MSSNPFSVTPPENLSAEDTLDLFVDVFTDFYKVPSKHHTFIHGPRGTGKSMMFRFLQPDCQMLKEKTTFDKLEYFAVLVPMKKTALNLTELERLGRDQHKNAENIFNEHFLISFITVRIFEGLNTYLNNIEDTDDNRKILEMFCNTTLCQLLIRAGHVNFKGIKANTIKEVLKFMQDTALGIHHESINYLKRIAFSTDSSLSYQSALFGYYDFLIPLANAIRLLPFTPNGPLYLMIDDADNLSLPQTKILNSWVNSRSTEDVTLKISTQMRYKTRYTVNGLRIDTPHDYSEVNISDVYTGDNDKYKKRVLEVIRKRLAHASITVSPEGFFPPNKKQEEKLSEIRKEFKEKWQAGEGRGNKPTDDSLRYAVPEYIRRLKGTSKSGSTYSYAGLDQLVHISSGVMRWFLEPAYHMYAEECSNQGKDKCDFISPSVQNEIIKQRSDLFYNDLDELIKDSEATQVEIKKLEKLKNLIDALGGIFHQILITKDRSERKVFSIALSNRASEDVEEILALGVSEGFLHKTKIGNKEGTGKTDRYVLNRLLAPHYKLDPSGFAGYQFVTNDTLRNAINNPKSLLGVIKTKGVDATLENAQADLFDSEVA